MLDYVYHMTINYFDIMFWHRYAKIMPYIRVRDGFTDVNNNVA